MGGFFSLDGPFARFGNMLADILILSFLWIVFSIPIFTIGASTTALYYVATRRVSDKEGYIFRDFFKSFKNNFKVATIVWLIILVVGIVLAINIRNIDMMGNLRGIFLPLQLCFFLELSMLTIYIFPIIARFDMSIKELFKNSFFMANRHLVTTVFCVLTGISIFIIGYVTIIFFLVGMGVYVMVTSYLFVRVFKKYRPELDVDDYESLR